MIRITTFPPSAALAPYINFLWVAETTDGLAAEPIATPPSGFILLTMFTSASRYEMKLDDEEFKVAPRAALQGHHFGPIVSRALSDDTSAVGVMFKPTAFHQMWKVNMSELTNKITDAEPILGPDLTHLLDRLALNQSHDQRIQSVIAYLESVLRRQTITRARSEKIVEFMQQHFGTMPVADIASRFKLNNRALERIFSEEVGISPKYLNRVIQFNNILKILKYTPEIRWADLATRAGYYDQAHMIKAFIEFAGKSPLTYEQSDHRFTETHLTKEAGKKVNTYE